MTIAITQYAPGEGLKEFIQVHHEVYRGDLISPDGLARRGTAIHVVDNGAGAIAEVRFDPSDGTGTLVAMRPVVGAETPTTGALFGSAIYAVDARFGSMTGPYQVFRVPI